ncbi:MAG: hypothetical protein BWY11_02255 [Firmicutes bacterium ADurb.Bin182]|nr:MAG: hypothetical protein BWY11_02255 [Firmicutes bacterium ADurb.Bin182]
MICSLVKRRRNHNIITLLNTKLVLQTRSYARKSNMILYLKRSNLMQ